VICGKVKLAMSSKVTLSNLGHKLWKMGNYCLESGYTIVQIKRPLTDGLHLLQVVVEFPQSREVRLCLVETTDNKQ